MVKSHFKLIVRYLNYLWVSLFLVFTLSCNHTDSELHSPLGSNDIKHIQLLIDSSKTVSYESSKLLLEKVLKLSKTKKIDSLELKATSSLAILNYRKDLEQYRHYSQTLLNRAVAYKDTLYIAKGNYLLGSYYNRKTIIDSAYYYFNNAKAFYLVKNDSLKVASSMLNMAIIETGISDYYASENTTISALSYLNGNTKPKTTRGLYNNLGVLSYESQQYEDALYWYNLAKDITQDARGKAVILNNMGLIYRDTKIYDKAIESFREALSLDIEDFQSIKAMVLDNLGYIYTLQDKPEGLSIIQNAFNIRNKNNYLRGQVVSQLHLGQYYFQQNKTVKAEQVLLNGLYQAKQINDSKNRLKILKTLYTNLPNQSYETLYISLNDSIAAVERNYKHQFAKIRFRTKQKEEDYKELETQYQLQGESLDSEERKNIWLATLFGIALLFIAVGFYIFKQRQKIHRQDVLIKQLNARAEEKQNLSVRLHDTIASDILLGLQHSEQLKTQFGGDKFNRLIAIFERAYNKARRISQDLNQDYFDKIPFHQKLENLSLEYGFKNDLNITLEGIEQIQWSEIHNTIKVAIYDTIKEGLTNILKHAKASKVVLKFHKINTSMCIEICDNGIGIDTPSSEKGIGLLNIERKVSDVSGNLTITPNTPTGTIIKITLPIVLKYE